MAKGDNVSHLPRNVGGRIFLMGVISGTSRGVQKDHRRGEHSKGEGFQPMSY